MDDVNVPQVGRWVSETAGIAGGAIAGGLVAGPVGAAGGAVIGEVLKTTLGEMADQMLSRGEVRRTNKLAALAESEIQYQLDHGRPLRSDGFFDTEQDDRSTAEELFEGVFLAAKREHEEKKIALIAKMLARFAFTPSLDRAECNLLTRLAEHLSYRQLCLLGLFNLNNRGMYELRNDPTGDPWNLQDNDPKVSILQEILDLHRQTLIQQKSLEHSGHDIMPNIFLIAPARTQVVAGLGGLLTNLMDLATAIPLHERNEIAALLR